MVLTSDKLVFTMGEYTGNIHQAVFPE
jgi:hypothetical protein